MALARRTDQPLPSEREEYIDLPQPDGMRIGIALSGGGIRSAAFNLGALQALQDQRIFQQADFLAAVSGGNYVASALTISAAYSEPKFDNGMPLWGRSSPEERHLRQNTDYLVPKLKGRVWLALSVIYGFILNYLPFVLCAFILGRVVGWLLHAVGLKLSDLRFNGLSLPTSRLVTVLLGAALGSLVFALLFVAFRRFHDSVGRQGNYGDTRSERVATILVMIAGGIGVVLALPVLAGLYRTASVGVLSGVLGEGSDAFDRPVGRLAIGSMWLLIQLGVAATAIALSRRFRARRLMLVLSSLAGAGLLFLPTVSSLDYATQHGIRSDVEVIWLAAAILVVLFMAVKVHNRRYSIHLFYRERLNSAFALWRGDRGSNGKQVIAEPIRYDEPLYFSRIEEKLRKHGRRLPKLIVCCAVNLTSHDVPVGRFAESFTFTFDRSGGPVFGYRETDKYEGQDGQPGTRLTLPSIMAVSGAALSPLMGRFTYPPLRFLMALTNVRLGVWIKNPDHKSWQPREGSSRWPAWLVKLGTSVKHGWWEPGALYVLREALGGANKDRRFIYLTDGGHWENLGLVELLRRRCTHVLCFDATADHAGAGLDIGRAIALARSELRANVFLDPTPVMPRPDGLSADMAVEGRIQYPDQPEAKDRIVYVKAVLTEQASWDLHAFKVRDARFPNHSTARQVFTDEQFEAYRSLGYQAGCRAVKLLNIPNPLLDRKASGNGELPVPAVIP